MSLKLKKLEIKNIHIILQIAYVQVYIKILTFYTCASRLGLIM